MARRVARVPVGHKAYAGKVKNSRGNLVDAWDDPTTVKVFAVYSNVSAKSNEPGVADRVVTGLTMLAPVGFTCGPHDRFVVRGREFNVDGEIADWSEGPYRYAPGVEVKLERVDG